ncbi:MAG: hypothetical protein HUU25_09965 [Candidatus Sumerlaeia bacterium]|nr:hypothetical protein [Candidatus Sumerlaeia bacterium]
MDEMVTDAQAEWIMAVGCGALFFATLVARLAGGERCVAWTGRRTALGLIALGPLIYTMWRVDAVLIEVMGFDRLLRLAVEAAAAVVLGLGLGLWMRGDQRTGMRDQP